MKTPWISVLDHRFLDARLTNCRHVGGTFVFSAPPPPLHREINTDVLAYSARLDGQWLRYTLNRPLPHVIGTEVRVRLRLVHVLSGGYVMTLCWGGNLAGQWAIGAHSGDLTVGMGGHQHAWRGFPERPGEWFDIAWSWRVSGQSILSFNGKVVGAWNGIETGRPYELGMLGLGSGLRIVPGLPPSPPGLLPWLTFGGGECSLFQLSVLTEETSSDSLDAAFPLGHGDARELAACREPMAGVLRNLASLFRGLISTILAEEAARPGGAVGVLSAKLHASAMNAAIPLAAYVDGDDGALAAFRAALEKFFLLLKNLASGHLPELERRIRQAWTGVDLPPGCRQTAKRLLARGDKNLARLQPLLDAVTETARTTLGIDWNG